MDYFKRYYITLKDIGLKRIIKRIRYDSRTRIDKIIPISLSHFLIGFNKKSSLKWKENNKLILEKNNLNFQKNFNKNEDLKFLFCNKEILLRPYFSWNDNSWERLWQFNLHYFDWARESIDLFLDKKEIDDKLLKIPLLIDHWINTNRPGDGDGWHSYTISLRIRNWIWALRIFPEIKNKKILYSIWEQICWLYNHMEDANGGNHYLENLCTLVIGSLQFESKKSIEIYKISLKKLNYELREQILDDGGHEERSASYHILILNRLVEVGLTIKLMKKDVPKNLLVKIEKMLKWAILIRLDSGNYPRFNDSPEMDRSEIDNTISFAQSFLCKQFTKSLDLRGIRKKLIDQISYKSFNLYKIDEEKIIDLKDTGWTIIRPGKGWEIIFKSGQSCPKHLPGHVHSDLFTFDIYKNTIPIIAECGTSTYENNEIRKYERSGSAHNVLEIFNPKNNSEVIEPIDVWSSFRAGKKAKTFKRNFGQTMDNNFWVEASHDGYKSLKIDYSRKINFRLDKESNLIINIKNTITSNKYYSWRQWIHFSPEINESFIKEIIENIKLHNKDNFLINDNYYSYGFGKRKKRKSICFYGTSKKGIKIVNTDLILSNIIA